AVRMLVDAGADLSTVDLDARDRAGQTLLMLAVLMRSDLDTISWLIRSGADVNAGDDDGETPLMHATCHGDDAPKVIAALLDAGADPTIRNAWGWTALDYAWNAEDRARPELLRILTEAIRQTRCGEGGATDG
ncbi:MAG: ankyrin repeat domain-containing protein, partial [Synergistaceae bacterium]|nr:ankyrin repeat domain-containing protein [Synergistaceae bacterium]